VVALFILTKSLLLFNVFYYRPAVLLLHLECFKAEEVPAQNGDRVEMVFVKSNVSRTRTPYGRCILLEVFIFSKARN
jgi:hypothetical protein